MLAQVVILPKRSRFTLGLKGGKFLDLFMLLPKVFKKRKTNRFDVIVRGRKTFKTVVALARVCHVERIYNCTFVGCALGYGESNAEQESGNGKIKPKRIVINLYVEDIPTKSTASSSVCLEAVRKVESAGGVKEGKAGEARITANDKIAHT